MTSTEKMTDFEMINANVERLDFVNIPDKVFEHAIEGITDISNDMGKDETFDVYDLHQRLFNEDYFIIGYHPAKVWLDQCKDDVFTIIEVVINYEKEMFGESTTDINAESIANMYAYIKGEELINLFLNNAILEKTDAKFSKSQMTDLMISIKKWW